MATSPSTDNLAVPASGYDRFSIVAPTDPRLPGGGGNTLSGLNDLNPAYNGLINNQLRLTDNYGTQIQHFNGFDLTVNARPRGGVTLYGGDQHREDGERQLRDSGRGA